VNTNESTKSKARAIIDQLPDSASWDDVMYELYVREAIDAGLADVAAGRTYTSAEVRARLEQRIRRTS
jgi:predicted transcriptional regulator